MKKNDAKLTPQVQLYRFKMLRNIFCAAMVFCVLLAFACMFVIVTESGDVVDWFYAIGIIAVIALAITAAHFGCFSAKFNMLNKQTGGAAVYILEQQYEILKERSRRFTILNCCSCGILAGLNIIEVYVDSGTPWRTVTVCVLATVVIFVAIFSIVFNIKFLRLRKKLGILNEKLCKKMSKLGSEKRAEEDSENEKE